MVTLTGFDYATFHWLIQKFAPLYDKYSPHSEDGLIKRIRKQGRPRLMTAVDCLGLNLAWTRLRGSMVALQLIFGLTETSVSIYLRFGRRLLVNVLSSCPDAAICIPSAEKIKEYQEAISKKHPDENGILSGQEC